MAITRFDPFREFSTLQDRMNRLFGDVYLRDEQLVTAGAWVPPVDIFETDAHDLVIKAELPDLTREDIDVTVEHNTLTLRGTKKSPVDVKDEQYRRSERSVARGHEARGAVAVSHRSGEWVESRGDDHPR